MVKYLLIISSFTIFFSGAFSQTKSSTTIGGYGELHYNEPDGSTPGQFDFHRFVIYLDHYFNNWISFKSEVEIEHTLIEEPPQGEVAIEQAFLDLHFRSWLGLRVGLVLIPVGIINQTHEPPTFHGVERPQFDHNIIPTTWRESGFGFYGKIEDIEGLAYQLYLTEGLNGEHFTNEGIYDGKQEGFRSNPEHPALSAKIDYDVIAGLKLGVSGYQQSTTISKDSLSDGMPLTLLSADARFNFSGFEARAVAAVTSIGNTDAFVKKFNRSVVKTANGFYIEAAYDVLGAINPESDQQVLPFFRFEKMQLEATDTVGASCTCTQHDSNVMTIGATWRPHTNVVFKTDYQFETNVVTSEMKKTFNIGIGYSF